MVQLLNDDGEVSKTGVYASMQLHAIVVTLAAATERRPYVTAATHCLRSAGATVNVMLASNESFDAFMCKHSVFLNGYTTPLCTKQEKDAGDNCPLHTSVIHRGKLGHWVSWIRVLLYAQQCWNKGTCTHVLFLEDDALLDTNVCDDFVRVVKTNVSTMSWFSREGPLDKANLINAYRAEDMLAFIQRKGIDRPLDHFMFARQHMGPEFHTHKRVRTEFPAQPVLPSTIVGKGAGGSGMRFLEVASYDKSHMCR